MGLLSDAINETLDENEISSDEKPAKPKKTRKVDKRSISSKLNAEKARKVKLERIKEQKAKPQLVYEPKDDSESDSDDEVLIIKPKSKKKDPKMETEISELKGLVAQLSQKKSEITVVDTPKINPKTEPIIEQPKKKILNI